MRQKIVWAFVGLGLALVSVLVVWAMPDQIWMIRDARGEEPVTSWALLWRAWPLVLVGVGIGTVVTLALVVPSLQAAYRRDRDAEIASLMPLWDQRLAEGLAQATTREAQATAREVAAIAAAQEAARAQAEAQVMMESAERMDVLAAERIREVQARIGNAIHAAQRLKRRARTARHSADELSVP